MCVWERVGYWWTRTPVLLAQVQSAAAPLLERTAVKVAVLRPSVGGGQTETLHPPRSLCSSLSIQLTSVENMFLKRTPLFPTTARARHKDGCGTRPALIIYTFIYALRVTHDFVQMRSCQWHDVSPASSICNCEASRRVCSQFQGFLAEQQSCFGMLLNFKAFASLSKCSFLNSTLKFFPWVTSQVIQGPPHLLSAFLFLVKLIMPSSLSATSDILTV